ncbi:hypothetical protein [Desulfobacter vibrioformis]|uniref:hypothetical protein n=1 Tax=Desulfobacter vibrioformis TaxID=34031 RepID=UPI0012EBF795|nr:hypothetical protein [Desulfobacter vibrioformis]
MRFKLLTKFFLSFLVTGLMLVGLMIGAMQFFTFRNFGEYVDQNELDKLSGLARDLAREYQVHGSWAFVRDNHEVWIRIFIRNGLIKHDKRLPNDLPLEPRHSYPRRLPNLLETGPRISLFDTEQRIVMGHALTMEGQVTRPVMLEDKTIGYLGIRKLGKLPNPLDAYYLAQQRKLLYLVGGLFLILSVLISYFWQQDFWPPSRRCPVRCTGWVKDSLIRKWRFPGQMNWECWPRILIS